MKKGNKTVSSLREHINNREQREKIIRERQSKNNDWRREKAQEREGREREEDEIEVTIPKPNKLGVFFVASGSETTTAITY